MKHIEKILDKKKLRKKTSNILEMSAYFTGTLPLTWLCLLVQPPNLTKISWCCLAANFFTAIWQALTMNSSLARICSLEAWSIGCFTNCTAQIIFLLLTYCHDSKWQNCMGWFENFQQLVVGFHRKWQTSKDIQHFSEMLGLVAKNNSSKLHHQAIQSDLLIPRWLEVT